MKIVRVLWEDSAGLEGWVNSKTSRRHTAAKCSTVGFLVKKNFREVTLSQSVCSDNDDRYAIFSIPMSCIKSIKELK